MHRIPSTLRPATGLLLALLLGGGIGSARVLAQGPSPDSPPFATQSNGTVYVPLAFRSATPNSNAPTSEQLIDDAESSGSITREQALTYSVYAAFGDSLSRARASTTPRSDP